MPRNVILGFGLSLDGYIARKTGAIDFLTIDQKGEALMADFFATIDTTIMGRKTALGWVKMRAAGEIPDTPDMTNYVVFRRWKPGKRDGFEVINGQLADFIERQKTQNPAKTSIWVEAAGSPAVSSRKIWSMNSSSVLDPSC